MLENHGRALRRLAAAVLVAAALAAAGATTALADGWPPEFTGTAAALR